MNKGLLIVISGPAGVGKGTVIKKLLEKEDYVYSVSVTTRKPRPGEADGVSYYFVGKEEFQKKINTGEMLEYAEYVGNFYGTPRSFVTRMLDQGKNVVLEIDTAGALQIKRQMPDALLVFISPPSMEDLEQRLRGRGTEDEASIEKRLDAAKKELALISKYDYVVINDDNEWEKTANEIESIVSAEKHSVKRRTITKPELK
ncbi:MAG: guanylate kinase [Clostridiales bacterium]|jgi:guanylate kinase|nr:guanylate kinase [Clostridiales bacterium]